MGLGMAPLVGRLGRGRDPDGLYAENHYLRGDTEYATVRHRGMPSYRVGNHMIAGWRPSHGGGGDRCRDVVAAVVGRDGFVPARQQRIGQR